MAISMRIDKPYNVLLVQNNFWQVLLTQSAINRAGASHFTLEHVDCLSTAAIRIAEGGIDVALIDLSLPDFDLAAAFSEFCAACLSLPIVLLTGYDDEGFALDMLKAGAQDYLLKDELQPRLLTRSLRYAIERQRAKCLESVNSELTAAKYSLVDSIKNLEQANEDLSCFTYFFGHDLQEPVRNIAFFTRELEEDLGDRLSGRARQDMQYITEGTQRVQNLLQAIMALSRAREATLDWGSVDLQRCVTAAAGYVAARVAETGAAVTRRADRACLP